MRLPVRHIFLMRSALSFLAMLILFHAGYAQSNYPLPTVIHIIHNPSAPQGTPTHPTDDQVEELLDWTNEVLRGQITCGIDRASVDMNIQLCKATQDIQENSSESIYRIESPLHKMDMCEDELALKRLPRQTEDRYPNTDYLNIYIVSEICNSCDPLGCQVGGFAAYPPSHGSDFDGIVLEAITVTSDDCNLRKTFIHELGHYLGLYHTFRNACENTDCEKDGDGICDTPPDDYTNIYPSNPCLEGGSINSCGTDVNASDPNNPFSLDQDDMSDNFMDYSPTSCLQRFTEGQADKMQETLESDRRSLLESRGCEESCTPPIQFSLSIPDTIIAGQAVQITNNTVNATSYRWLLDRQEYTTQDLEHQWDTSGIYTIRLIAENNTGCRKDTSFSITVDCGIYPEIIMDTTILALGDTIFAQANTNNLSGLSYTWFVNGQMVSTNEQLQYVPATGGNYAISLEVCNEFCCERAAIEHVGIGQCPTGKEGNHWIFGYDGIHLDFSTGVPVEQANKPMKSHEVSSIATTPQGEILFYSNGELIFDRMDSKEIMEYDSTGLPPYFPIELCNNTSVTQPNSATQAVVLPQPGNDSLWYLFYSEGFRGDPSDLDLDTTLTFYCAIINMNKRVGKGKVMTYDMPLLTPATERVAATRHCNGEDWWIISSEAGSNSKLAWLLTKDGIEPPVISTTGRSNGWISNSKIGQMKISQDGTKLCKATFSNKNGPPSLGYIECFQFDNSTGKLSNNIVIVDSLRPYGIELSMSGKYLFLTGRPTPGSPSSHPYGVLYTNLGEGHEIEKNPLIKLSHDSVPSTLGIQLAPNGSIYVANNRNPYISEIRYPDNPSKVEYIHKSVPFENGEGWHGLPYFPAGTYTPDKPWLEGPSVLCDTLEEALFFVKGNCRYQDYHWEIDGPSQIHRTNGDSIYIRPVHSDSLQELSIMKFTACQTKYDTLTFIVDSCKMDTISEDKCSLAFEWTDLDTLLCRGEETQLRFATNASSAELFNVNSGQRQDVSLSGLKISGLTSATDFELRLNGSECDSVIPFTIHINAPLNLSDLQLDSIVCAGDSAEIKMITDADMIDIFDDEQTVGWRNPTFPLIVPVVDSTQYFIRLRQTDRGCDTLFSFTVKEEKDNVTEDTTSICFGDTLNWRGQELFSPGDYEEIVAQAQGCDSVYRLHLQVLSLDTTLIEDFDCEISSIQNDTIFYQNILGCDSLIITTTYPLQTDTVYLSSESCDPTQTGMDTAYYQNTAGCDSVVITSMTLLPSDTTYQSGITCDLQESGTDTVLYTNQFGCDSILIIDNKYRDINVELGPDQTALHGDTLLLIAQTNARADSIYWRPPYSPELQRQVVVQDNQRYMIFIRDSSGCLISDTVDIFLEEEPENEEIYVPNIFTPNGDGINDEFRPVTGSSSIKFESMQIFDRWGNLIHESQGELQWNGRSKGELVANGVYVYLIRYKDGAEERYVSGTVTLVR